MGKSNISWTDETDNPIYLKQPVADVRPLR